MGERTDGTASGTYDNSNGSFSRTPPRDERFGGSDEPPSQPAVNEMNQGTDASGDEAQVRTIPVAVGAMVTLVNLPDGCDFFNGADAVVNDAATTHDETTLYSNANTADSERIRLSKAILEDIWAGDGTYDQWGEIFGENIDDANPDAGPTAAECRDKPIIRVVRLDDSGSTYVYKDYLNAIDPAEGWLTDFIDPDTRDWPNPDRQVGGVDTLIPAATAGGGGQRTTASGTDGSIAYNELGSARGGSGNPFVRQADATEFSSGGSKFWIEAQNGNGEYLDAAQQTGSFRSTGGAGNIDKGARCSAITDYAGLPTAQDETLAAGGWTGFSMVDTNTAGQYGICSATYALAFDDNADAYGDSDAEEARARTVKDYLTAALSTAGQAGSGAGSGTGLFAIDQAPLPLELRDIAIEGVNAIDWCKGGCGSAPPPDDTDDKDPPPNNNGNGGNGGGGNQNPPPPPIVEPLNTFTIPSARRSGNAVVARFRLPGAGALSVSARGRYKQKVRRRVNGRTRTRTRTRRLTVGRATAQVTRAGDVAVRLPLSSKTRRALRTKGRRVTVTITATFTPTGGKPRTVTRKLTLRGSRR
jgi:hypothetical protein